ncbi:MAG: hypothetical protein QMD09_14035 [Desulfatibacillaceae bacterium]|nr:hypothetical protein [Desulfatibacillaceae bacterium]
MTNGTQAHQVPQYIFKGNMDLEAMEIASEMIKRAAKADAKEGKQPDAKEVKQAATDALAQLQGEGIYGMLLVLEKKQKAGDAYSAILDEIKADAQAKGFFEKNTNNSLELVKDLVTKPLKLFLAIDFYTRVLIYARHQADGMDAATMST